MIGEDFLYGSTWLSEFDMIMCSPEDAQQFVPRDVERGDITSVRAKPNHYSTRYTNTLSLNFFIMKDAGCATQGDFRLTGDEVHYIRSWLESPKKPTELIVSMEEDELTTHYFGLFTAVQPYLFNDDCYGLFLTFTCDSPYGYSDEYKSIFYINGSNIAVSGRYVNLSAEREEYLYPVVTINSTSTFGNSETLVIKNESDNNNEMSITLPSGKSSIVIDCEKKMITDEDGSLVSMGDIGVTTPVTDEYNFISTDMFVFYWLSLVPDENSIVFTPSETNTISSVEISARYIVKSGGF